MVESIYLIVGGVVTVVATFFIGLVRGRSQGRESERTKAMAKHAQIVRKASEVTKNVAKKDSTTVSDLLKSEWVRQPNKGK